jgi:hypothetical protein
MLHVHMEIISVYSHNHTRHRSTLCGQNVESLNGKLGSI